MHADAIDWGEDFTRLTDKQIYLAHMDRLARKLRALEIEQRETRLEYWRWQAKAYPVYECNHPDTRFCPNCQNNMEVPDAR